MSTAMARQAGRVSAHDLRRLVRQLRRHHLFAGPDWDVVRRWRGQQEVTLRGRALTPAEEDWIDRFVLHYERITRSMMDGGVKANCIVHIDEQRNVVSISNPTNTAP